MNLLIIGGTRFVGRHLVDAALAHGHQVTLFNRGQSNPTLFPNLTHIQGDRAQDLGKLNGRSWDAVIDTCGYLPAHVNASAQQLLGCVKQYVFISTISVYAFPMPPNNDENGSLTTIDEETADEVNNETYGALKVLCEQAVQRHFPDNNLIIRPGFIVGPYDLSDRFTYWVRRAAEGGLAIAPDLLDMAVQVIDARDLAEWNINLVEQAQTGIFNAVGPETPISFGDILANCQQVAATDVAWQLLPESFLLAQDVKPWQDLPFWTPSEEGDNFNRLNHDRALATGLTHRPIITTIADTLAWHKTRPANIEYRVGLDPEKERAVLAAWQAQL